MDALDLLLNRRSIAKLSAPAPEGVALENIIKAGLRAPDHAALTPWHFVIAQGTGLNKLAAILEQSAINAGREEAVVEKAKKAPFRAPMVITVIAKITPHEKVPAVEQVISAGCAAHAMQMAAVAQGFQGFWRSGKWMFDAEVRKALGASEQDEIVGFLYLGTPGCTPMKVPERELSKFVSFL
ncbi:NAD(P)H nitroreductase [Vibrio genomosp. F10]|uniref:Putative NAD(P)H nitroreductase n=2 Tax=Vibrio genomosp. F10 TaxID=723171 RepID=A0A1B9R0U4_9VIBR|nr:NAD(P)H nitroreductase [Vibrio genomosp. F10]OCH77655.1 nitroreductase [Vibrio genomosp. F10]OEE31941.1 nitroreductase [Vibrio genomosp. F10 str. ZF-129]OEE94322.1 nitroreductase [Vibrio genomosp. F10 str. 9ZC157]OEF03215.1 nitroreductase [Vibrio genomosp. F10 str. 9ZD137]OEF04953.1 nitroreductase [Vibrio genomosp. F10 str. 9ZB36]